jgi:hypothetical protein
MNKTTSIFFAGLLLLTGCARNYVITLHDGEHIRTKGKPHLVEGYYVFKDGLGREATVRANSVREIAPPSMVTDQTASFKPVSSK